MKVKCRRSKHDDDDGDDDDNVLAMALMMLIRLIVADVGSTKHSTVPQHSLRAPKSPEWWQRTH